MDRTTTTSTLLHCLTVHTCSQSTMSTTTSPSSSAGFCGHHDTVRQELPAFKKQRKTSTLTT
eukprot:2866011-Amphidinium_carterae.1